MPQTILRAVVAGLVMLGMASPAGAQIFKVQGGTSTLFGANGGSVQFKAPNYDGQVGAGIVNGAFRFGAVVHTKIMGNTVTVGDETVRFDLPTDVFGANHFFLARGAGLLHSYASGNVYTFLGTTSEGFVTPFFIAARSADRVAAIYVDRKLSPHLRLVSRNLISRRKSAIQSVEWTPQRGVRLSAAAGMGSNQGYAASAVDIDRPNFKLKAAYIAEGMEFERVRTPAILTAELEKENVSFAYRPVKYFSVSAGHQNILQPPYRDQGLIRATVNEVSTTLSVAKFSLGGGLYQSRIGDHSTTGTNLFASRDITKRLSVAGNLFHSRPDLGSASQFYTASSHFAVNTRLGVSGTISRTGNQTAFGLGGELTSNRLSLGVNSQTVYIPLSLNRPFQQTVSVNASANLFADVRATVTSFVAPDGRVRYSFGLSRFLYRQQGMSAGPSAPSFRFPKFLVVGVVVDERGNPVEGAAVHIGNHLGYSDQAGGFMVRMEKRGPHIIRVVPDEFIAPGLYEVVSAPASLLAQPEDAATAVRIVVRRVPVKAPTQ